MFKRFASSSSLALLVSSGSLDYYSCEEVLEDTPINEQQLFELSLAGLELADGENWPSTVQIYSVSSSLSPCLIDCCIQIDEHMPDRLHGHVHVDNDDTEGQLIWDPLALETSWH